MMAVKDFEEYIENVREDFRVTLDTSDMISINMEATILSYFKKCTNQFEEDTLIENLKEEFENYLKEVKEQA